MCKINSQRLAELESRAKASLSHKDNLQHYVIVMPEDILALVAEIRELRALADPQALTAAFMAGAAGNKGGKHEKI